MKLYWFVVLLALSGCGSGTNDTPEISDPEFGGSPEHLVPEDEKILIAFARDLPEYYKAIGATMPPDTLESLKTATSSSVVDKHYAHVFYAVKYVAPLVSRTIHLNDARTGRAPPIPVVHSLISGIRELTNYVRTNRAVYSWRGALALADCLKLIHSKFKRKEAFAESFQFDSLYKSLSRYFRLRRPNQGDPNTIAISFLEKQPFGVFLASMKIIASESTISKSFNDMKRAITYLKDTSPQRDPMYALMDKYVELVEKRSHAQTQEEESNLTFEMQKFIMDNQKLIDSIQLP